MRHLYLLLATLLCATVVVGQPSFDWAGSFGAPPGENTWNNDMAVDANDNVITTGQFTDTVDFDIGTGVFNMFGQGLIDTDAFILKLDAAGNFVWAKQFGGASGTAQADGNGVTVDQLGNIYTIGTFTGTTDFDPGAGVFNLTASAASDTYISKLDPNGNFIWAKQFAGTSSDWGFDIELDNQNNIYTSGYFNGTCDFDPGTGVYNITSAGGWEVFVCKLDSNGNFHWAGSFEGTGNEFQYGLEVDGIGNNYITGNYGSTVDFDPGTGVYNLTSVSSGSGFICALDSAGNFRWAGAITGTTVFDQAGIYAVKVHGSDSLIIAGEFKQTVDFDPGTGVLNATTTSNSTDMFYEKLDTAGNFGWMKHFEIQGGGLTRPFDLHIDAAQNIYCTGSLGGNTDFDPSASVFNLINTTSTYDGFISKHDGAGNFIWALQLFCLDNVESSAIELNQTEDGVYLSGRFEDTTDFDPGTGVYEIGPVGSWDGFVMKLGQCAQPDLPTLTANNGAICMGSTDTLNITGGNLNAASNWYWYTGGCGNTLIDSGTVVYVNPSVTTTYYVRGEGGCVVGGSCDSVTVIVTDMSASSAGVTSNYNGEDVSCNGDSDGQATATPTGGTSPYTYAWSSGGSSAVETGLGAGSYSVTITDANGCTEVKSVTVTEPTAVAATTTSNQASCGNSDGDATANGTGGTGAYSYQWDANAANQTTQTANNLAAGNYDVTITDANGCTATATATVSNPNAPTASIANQTDLLCFGDCDGDAMATQTGGTSPYSYAWSSSGNTTDTETALCAGTHTVTVTDANNCASTAVVTITEPTAVTGTMNTNPTSGQTNCDGTAMANPTGGTPGYTYLWDANAANQTTQQATGLCVGTYCVTVTDNNGCTWDTCGVSVAVGIGDRLQAPGISLSVYPNPSGGVFSIEIGDLRCETIEVVDANGRLVQEIRHTKNTGIISVDLSGEAKGVYFLLVETEKGRLTEKLIIE